MSSGTGKNKLADQLCFLMKWPREYMQLHRDTTVQALTATPTLIDGVVTYEDSPLVKAVRDGHVLVLDEADKAPTEVVVVLKGLLEDGLLNLGDGRKIVSKARVADGTVNVGDRSIVIHDDFRLFVLANRPGYPFLGNDFFREAGDCFSSHIIKNPDVESQLQMLRAYATRRNAKESSVRKLVAVFDELRMLYDDGILTYPYSVRELVNVIKHLDRYPADGVSRALDNVLSWDGLGTGAKRTIGGVIGTARTASEGGTATSTSDVIREVLMRHGISMDIAGPADPRSRLSRARSVLMTDIVDSSGVPSPLRLYPLVHCRGKQLPLRTKSSSFKFGSAREVQATEIIKAHADVLSEEALRWNIASYSSERSPSSRPATPLSVAAAGGSVLVTTSSPATLHVYDQADPRKGHMFDISNPLGSLKPQLSLSASGGIYIHALPGAFVHRIDPTTKQTTEIELPREFFGSSLAMSPWVTASRRTSETTRVGTAVSGGAADQLVGFCGREALIVEYHPRLGDQVVSHHVEFPEEIAKIEGMWCVSSGSMVVEYTNDEGLHNLGILRVEKDENSDSNATYAFAKLLLPRPPGDGNSSGPFDLVAVHAHADTRLNKTKLIFQFPQHTAIADVSTQSDSGEVKEVPLNLLKIEDESALAHAEIQKSFYDPREGLLINCTGNAAVQVINLNTLSANSFHLSEENESDALEATGSGSARIVDIAIQSISPSTAHSDIASSVHAVVLMSTGEVKTLQVGSLEKLRKDAHATNSSIDTAPEEEVPLMISNDDMHSSPVDVFEAYAPPDADPAVAATDSGSQEYSSNGGPAGAGGNGGGNSAECSDNESFGLGSGGSGGGGSGGSSSSQGGGGGGGAQLNSDGTGGYTDARKTALTAMSSEQLKAVNEQVLSILRSAESAAAAAQEAMALRASGANVDAASLKRYDATVASVSSAIVQLKGVLEAAEAKQRERQWLKNQLSGDIDDQRLVDGITGDGRIFKRRGTPDKKHGLIQSKPKRLAFLIDCSASMARMNTWDGRLDRMAACAALIIEALQGFEHKFEYSLVGHSGTTAELALVDFKSPPTTKADKAAVIDKIYWHARGASSGDRSVEAAAKATVSVTAAGEADDYIVFLFSDANLGRYGVSPAAVAAALKGDGRSQGYCVLIAEPGAANWLIEELPLGRGHAVMNPQKLPQAFKEIFAHTALES
jgi:hypothetical protein